MHQNLKIVIKYFISALFVFFVIPLHAQEKVIKINTDVLVVGGTASGISAGIQSARMGVNTMVVESTSWLGGMLTSAGVPAFDGNHLLPSGIFGEFRDQLYKVYGGPNKVATGWVSNTLFEPHVG
ncbi:MAG: FAD-dependent oxidoreductase, partial [Chitinophagaceae bacterium]